MTTEAEVRAAVDAAVPLPGDIQDSNTKVDLRFGLTMLEHKVSIEIWGNNVFDERTKFNTFNIPFEALPANALEASLSRSLGHTA